MEHYPLGFRPKSPKSVERVFVDGKSASFVFKDGHLRIHGIGDGNHTGNCAHEGLRRVSDDGDSWECMGCTLPLRLEFES